MRVEIGKTDGMILAQSKRCPCLVRCPHYRTLKAVCVCEGGEKSGWHLSAVRWSLVFHPDEEGAEVVLQYLRLGANKNFLAFVL